MLPAQRPDELRDDVEANLRSLRVERLDLVNLRLIEMPSGGPTLEDQLGMLEDLRRSGKLARIGVSNVDQATAQHALDLVDVAEIQNGYSVIDRQDDALVDFARERQITFVPFFPLGSAFRGGRETGGRRDGRTGCRQAWGDADPDRPGMVAGTLRPDVADSGHELDRAPRGEYGRGRARARRRRSRCP